MKFLKSIFKVFKSDETRFRWQTALSVASVFVILAIFGFVILSGFVEINMIYLSSCGVINLDGIRTSAFEYILSSLIDFIPFIVIFLIAQFFLGFYIAYFMVRPFKLVSGFCKKKLLGEDVKFNAGIMSDMQLLTNFSEFFFINIEKTMPVEIPVRYTNIHKPVFERGFFLHYGLFVFVNTIVIASTLFYFFSTMYERVVELTLSFKINYVNPAFFRDQLPLFDFAILFIVVCYVCFAIYFAYSLHKAVVVPEFAIFSTFRSFCKGRIQNRVHLLGSYFLRDDCRVINQYLDELEKKYRK